MRKIYISIICLLIVLLAACSKDNGPAVLPDGSISFQHPAGKDTIEMPLAILKDSAVVIGFHAALSGATSGSDHWIIFGVDTTRIADYRAKYGAALLMPTTSYFFFKPTTRLSAGETVSEEAQLNIGLQTKLIEYSTYVLPVVIRSVDGNPDGTATSRVLYLVFKTGKPGVINKQGWTIASVSSQNGSSSPANLLDNDNLFTFWATGLTQQMPQWVNINFNRQITFVALSYYLPNALSYPSLGGYPTSIQIETSMDGTTWEDKGVFAGNVVNNKQTISLGVTTARYLRFTALASIKYASAYEAIFISGIGLEP